MGTSEGARKGWSEESRRKRSEAMRRKWQDPEYQARRAAKEQDPQTKANRSAGAVRANADPERRRRQAEVIRDKFANDEGYRQKHSDGLRKAHADPQLRLAKSIAMKRAWQENREAFVNSLKATLDASRSPEGRERQRKAMVEVAAANPPTDRELAVAFVLNKLEIPYQLHAIRSGREMDIFVPSHNLNIEVDGNNHIAASLKARDAERDTFLKSEGYDVFRILNRQVDDASFVDLLVAVLE